MKNVTVNNIKYSEAQLQKIRNRKEFTTRSLLVKHDVENEFNRLSNLKDKNYKLNIHYNDIYAIKGGNVRRLKLFVNNDVRLELPAIKKAIESMPNRGFTVEFKDHRDKAFGCYKIIKITGRN